MITYKFKTFQELVDRVPSDKIAECLREFGIAFQQAKATAELVFLTAESLAKESGKEFPKMPERLFEVPEELEWIDDGKGEIKTTLTGFPDGIPLVCKTTLSPQTSPHLDEFGNIIVARPSL